MCTNNGDIPLSPLSFFSNKKHFELFGGTNCQWVYECNVVKMELDKFILNS